MLKNNGFHNRHSPVLRFSPLSLFSGGAPGAWYDPSDLTTLFQDSAGTTPVTAVEQPVGRMLDKSGYGNHAFQATSASRPVLSARYNLLTATETLSTQSVTTAATTQTLRFTGTGSITLTGTAIGVYTAGTYSVTTTAGSLTLTVLGTVTQADLRVANNGITQPAYQRVNTSTDYNTTGFLPYLRFDGVDDGLSTNSISFTATDKMSVFAGVRKLSDAAVGVIAELSTGAGSNNGAFILHNQTSPIGYRFAAGAWITTPVLGADDASVFAAPITNVITALSNFAGATLVDELNMRINGLTPTQSRSGSVSSGNYGNWPLYIGRRGGSSLPFNGQMYSMIIVGKAVTAGELSSTEAYVNQKTGAY